MAVLTAQELAALRQKTAATVATVTYTKEEINAALQAIENWFEANRANLGSTIEAAAPGIFSGAAKQKLVKFWLYHKFEKE